MTLNVSIAALPPMVEDAVTGSSARRIFMRRHDNDDADYVLVLVHGTADEVIPFQGSVDEAERRCAAGEDVTFLRYLETNHAAVPQSMLTALGWVEDRFAGRPSTSNCAERSPPG